jgi:hypothetical protein
MTRGRWLALGVLLAAAGIGAERPEQGNRPFELREWLGRSWTHERVRFALSRTQERRIRAGASLLDDAGGSVPYQVEQDETAGTSLSFHADLPAFGTSRYRLGPGTPSRETDLKVTEMADAIRLESARVGIALARRIDPAHGPIAAIRTASGRWVGGSSLQVRGAIGGYEVRVVARGPVYAEALCRLTAAAGQSWEWRFRVEAGEPVVLIDERGTGETARASLRLDLASGLDPTHILHRGGKDPRDDADAIGRPSAWKITDDPDPPFVLAPWLPWWKRVREGIWFGLYDEAKPDLLVVGGREPSTWVDPARGPGIPEIALDREPTLGMTFPAVVGERKWMLAAIERGEGIDTSTPQRLLVRFGDFPLDRVKDMVLEWKSPQARYPRLFLTPADLARLKKTFRSEPELLERLRREAPRPNTLDSFVSTYLATGDPELGAHLAATAMQWVKELVDRYLDQDAQVTLGFAPHAQGRLLVTVNLCDAILGSPHLSPENRQRLLAQLAFLGYTVNRTDYWSPERGFSANPNMTTSVAAYRAMIAGLIREHPLARGWIEGALRELRDNQLAHWSDADGGWLEAPHYAMVSYDAILAVLRMAQLAGIDNSLFDPRMEQVLEWTAKISTPPDSRILGRRHLPPIGNTYISETSGEYGLVAHLFHERDPAFSARMQWMQREQGDPIEPGVGGLFPAFTGYRTILRDRSLPEAAPTWGSERFAETGVVLRDGFPGPRETMLYLIAGTNHAHYDDDSGSITLWGRGRIVADDFGHIGNGPADDQSMVVSSTIKKAVMRVEAFAPAAALDYVRGGKPGWTREIAFVKHPGADGSSYVVLADTPAAAGDLTWRLWLTASSIERSELGALVRGREDVDTDVAFVHPADVRWASEERSRSTHGLDPAGRYGAVTTTQLGIVAKDDRGSRFLVVIYPRGKDEPAPSIRTLADGRGVAVETTAGTDYLFLAREPIEASIDDVSFRGTVGLAQKRAGRVSLTLGAQGMIRVGEHELASDRASSRDW